MDRIAFRATSPAFAWIEAGTVVPPEWRDVMLTELEAFSLCQSDSNTCPPRAAS